ncbi:MAG: DUF2231 domain-containing protein [Thermomicrobiales bacterium]
MESQTKFLGHPLHTMLIPLPLGLLSGAVAFDVLHHATGDDAWGAAATATMGAGIVGGLIAAPFGAADWFAIPPGTRAKEIGRAHGLGNAVVLGLFTANWWLRRGKPREAQPLTLGLSLAGITLAAVTGWLGGELVDRLGVGVDYGANLNAPTSLGNQPADAALGEVRLIVGEREERVPAGMASRSS